MGAAAGSTAKVLPFPSNGNQVVKGKAVDRINQFALYELGQSLQKLKLVSGDVDASQVFSEVWAATHAVSQLRNGKPMQIGISNARAKELQEALEAIMGEYYYRADEKGERKLHFPEPGTKITPWSWYAVTNSLEKFETVFADELREASSYIVPQRGITSTTMLVEHGEKAFADDLVPFIGIKAIADFKAAARCFAFDLHTASGYHSARAVEAVLETYYQTFLNKPGETLKGWNDYVEALKKLAAKKPKPRCLPDSRTLLSVDEIRFHHRNPLMHPRAVLNETDADMLLSIAKVAMVAMAQEIQIVWKERPAIATKVKAKQS